MSTLIISIFVMSFIVVLLAFILSCWVQHFENIAFYGVLVVIHILILNTFLILQVLKRITT